MAIPPYCRDGRHLQAAARRKILGTVYPTLFRMGPFTLHTFAVMVALGYLVGSFQVQRDAARAGLPRLQVARLAGCVLLAVLGGGRLGYLLAERRDLLLSWEALAVWHGGLVLYGGMIAALLTLIVGA